jgi:hypothetical protein
MGQRAWGIGHREDAEELRSWEGDNQKRPRLKAESSKGAFGRWRLEVGGGKWTTSIFPKSTNQRINHLNDPNEPNHQNDLNEHNHKNRRDR